MFSDITTESVFSLYIQHDIKGYIDFINDLMSLQKLSDD